MFFRFKAVGFIVTNTDVIFITNMINVISINVVIPKYSWLFQPVDDQLSLYEECVWLADNSITSPSMKFLQRSHLTIC